MEEVLQLLKKIQEDVNETKDSIRKSETNLLNKINEKFDDVQSKLQNLEATVTSQEQRLDLLERQARERNIVIFGMKENEQNYEDLHNNILQTLNVDMNIKCSNFEIQSIRRIGRKGDKTRPIVVTLTTLKRKIEILRNKKLLEKQNCYIKEDYPTKILEKRKELQEKAKEEREKGNKVLLKYDKLVIIPQKETHGKKGSKRFLSETPPDKEYSSGPRKPNLANHSQKRNTLSSYWKNKNDKNNTQNASPQTSSTGAQE